MINILPMLSLGVTLGANGLPYPIPIHPNLVHITLGLFIIGIGFDFAGVFFSFQKSVLKFFALSAVRSNFFDVGWYNVLVAALVTFLTVAIGFYEMLLANPNPAQVSPWGLDPLATMLWHGVGGVVLLALMVGMAVWRGFQRYVWRTDMARQVTWAYLGTGVGILFLMFLHGTLGAHMAADFGIHITADELLRSGQDPNLVLR
jgi:uncharacterized membrane protein